MSIPSKVSAHLATAQHYDSMITAWRAQCEPYDQDFDELMAPAIEFGRRSVERSNPKTIDADVYIFRVNEEVLSFSHVSTARLPKTDGVTLRVLWPQLAPKFRLDRGLDPSEALRTVFDGAFLLAQDDLSAQHIKMYLASKEEEQYCQFVANKLMEDRVVRDARVRASWFECTL